MVWLDSLWRLLAALLATLISLGLPLLAVVAWALVVQKSQSPVFLLSGFAGALLIVVKLGLLSVPGATVLALTVLWQNRSTRKDILREFWGFLGRLPVFLFAWFLFICGFNPWLALGLAFSLPLGAHIAEQLQDYPAYYKELSYAFGGRRRNLLALIMAGYKRELFQIFLRHMVRISGEFIIIDFLSLLYYGKNAIMPWTDQSNSLMSAYFAFMLSSLFFLMLHALPDLFRGISRFRAANG